MLKKLIFCRSKVNKANIKRTNRDGVEHIILTSFTLPPNVVMNTGLYPEDEVANSYLSLNRTIAPVEHPDINGEFISASDPFAINNFYAGAWNENPRKIDDGRIAVDKVINVQKALQSDKGKRLLDRIEELETNEKARPIHTSVGVFLEVEELDKPKTNAAGEEYNWIARNMVFDHDAILLDSNGAATPEKGVGIGVNKDKVDVEFVTCDKDNSTQEGIERATDLRTNKEMSFNEIHHLIWKKINETLDPPENWVLEVFQEFFIFEDNEGNMFKRGYIIDDQDNLSIQGELVLVERTIEFKPKNVETEDETMRDDIIALLGKLGITINADDKISDADLMVKYNEAFLAANSSDDDNANENDNDNPEISEVVTNAVKAALAPLQTEIEDLKANQKTADDAELSDLAQKIVNSDQYKGLDVDTIKTLGIEKVKGMAANCGIAFGLPSTMQTQVNSDADLEFELLD